jgi:hypothetical protein
VGFGWAVKFVGYRVGMPYKVVRVAGGYKVKKDQPGKPVYFSKEAQTKAMAEAQMRALYASEARKR